MEVNEAYAKGYERGYADCARFASNLIDNKCDRTEGCDKSRDRLNLQILLINNICEAAVQHGYDELCDLSNSEGLIASLEDWIKINNLEDFCHVVYVEIRMRYMNYVKLLNWTLIQKNTYFYSFLISKCILNRSLRWVLELITLVLLTEEV